MSNPILEIKSDKSSQPKVAVNLLPCRVHHDGPIDSTEAYWRPSENEGKQTAYFRGRRLQGKTVQVPEGYKGVVVEKREDDASSSKRPDGPEVIDVDDDDKVIAGGRLEPTATFDKMVIWGHEATAESGSDPYVRGIEEWVSLADQIHSY